MDYRKLVFYLITNFISVSNFIIVVLLIILPHKRKFPNSENTNLQDIKSDKIKVTSGKMEDIGSVIGMVIIMVFFFCTATLPVLYDIPYMINQSYVEYEGIILENGEKGITVEIAFENKESEKAEIPGVYDLQEGEKIILEYLPHMKMRMNWYIPDTKSK